MKITVIGTGYVGLVTGTIFANKGNEVWCVDVDAQKIANLKKGISPIYEPGLTEIITRHSKVGNLSFTDDINEAIPEAEIIFIGVGTPSREDGSVNLDYVTAAATDIGQALAKLPKDKQTFRVIVNKSTVPIGTGDFVTKTIKQYYNNFEVVSNPEFLREGQAVADALKPDRIVIGNGSEKTRKIMEQLYESFESPILFTDIKTAEMIKYASNAYLATSISFINQIALLCEAVGANAKEVAAGMKLDKRIGQFAFLDAGAGYGGSCFPKDVKGIIDIGKQHNVSMPVSDATETINKTMRNVVINKIKTILGDPAGKKVAIWGLAFKPETDDTRDAPALTILEWLLKAKAMVSAFDPVAQENVEKSHPDVVFASNPYEAAKDSDLVVLMTEWNEFSDLDLKKLASMMHKPAMVDARNVYGKKVMTEAGFTYDNIGNVQ